jgi:hypothetical protein
MLPLILSFIFSTNLFANDSGLQIYAAADMVYSQGLNQTSAADERLTMRAAEFSLFSPIDHNFDGVLTAVAHDENGELKFELHELSLSTSKLIERSRIKAGMFFLGVGRLNRFHQHDWGFTRAPKVHETFFGEEGVIDTGIEYTWLLPTSFFLEATFGVTSGHSYGHSHSAGTKPKMPTHYSRLSTFMSHGRANGTEIGLNYVGRKDNFGERMQIIGFDHVTKFREGRKVKWLLQSEGWYRNKKITGLSNTEEFGFYVFTDHAIAEQVNLGIRGDFFKNLDQRNIANIKENNISYGTTAQLTYRSSEFLLFRPSLSYNMERVEGKTIDKDVRFEMQAVYILGAHPAHEF